MAPDDDQSATRKPSGSKVNVGERRRRQRANSRLFYWTNFPARLVHMACDEQRHADVFEKPVLERRQGFSLSGPS
jgi:hypothetical protein